MMPPAPLIEGDRVTISKFAWWPACCVKCGAMAGLQPRVQKYAWVPPWTYLIVPLGLLPAAIVQLVLTKRAALTHPVCAACNGRWTMANVGWRLSLLGPLFGGIGVVIAGASANSNALMALGGLLFFPGILIFPILAHFLLVRPRTLRALFIDDNVIKLAGVSAPALDFLRGGPRM
jgi:hypothetical protein